MRPTQTVPEAAPVSPTPRPDPAAAHPQQERQALDRAWGRLREEREKLEQERLEFEAARRHATPPATPAPPVPLAPKSLKLEQERRYGARVARWYGGAC